MDESSYSGKARFHFNMIDGRSSFQDDSSMDCLEGSSDVSGTASVGAINLSSRPSSAPTSTALTSGSVAATVAPSSNNNNNAANSEGEMNEESVSKIVYQLKTKFTKF